jgi:hypothetical protein
MLLLFRPELRLHIFVTRYFQISRQSTKISEWISNVSTVVSVKLVAYVKELKWNWSSIFYASETHSCGVLVTVLGRCCSCTTCNTGQLQCILLLWSEQEAATWNSLIVPRVKAGIFRIASNVTFCIYEMLLALLLGTYRLWREYSAPQLLAMIRSLFQLPQFLKPCPLNAVQF